MNPRDRIPEKKRIVVKVGSSSLTHVETGGLDYTKLDVLVRELCNIHNQDKEVILVSSGAISVGRRVLGVDRSEERIGQFVSGRRNEFVLASKCGEHSCEPGTYYDFSYEAVTRSIDESLRNLRTDVIDLMQIHFGPDPEAVIRNGETVRAMKDAQKAGKIRFLGASIDGKLAEECIRSGDFDVMQMAYNLSNRGNEANIALARERGIGVLVRCGMGNGLFTPRVLLSPDRLSEDVRRRLFDSLDQIGGDPEQAIQTLMAINLRFLYENPGISSVIVGTKKPENIRKNMALLEQKTEDGLYARICRIWS